MATDLAVLSIDMQAEYYLADGPLRVPEGDAVLRNVRALLDSERPAGVPVIHIRHVSRDPHDLTFAAGSPNVEFMPDVAPVNNEIVITKGLPGAFHLTDLDQILRDLGVSTVLICGLLSFMCCDTTAREAHARGYQVLFVKDATAALPLGDLPAETVHAVACAVQAWLFSTVVSTQDAIARIGAR